MIYTVSDSAGLYEALSKAAGGDTINLASGNYGSLVLDSRTRFDIAFDGPVTITSEDPGAPATFAGLRLDGAANLTFDNVVFDYTYKSEHNIWSAPNFVRVSSDIIIRN